MRQVPNRGWEETAEAWLRSAGTQGDREPGELIPKQDDEVGRSGPGPGGLYTLLIPLSYFYLDSKTT